jgi:hypothetical protein
MKKTIMVILIALSFGACTENQRARNFGGTEKVTLPKGERLVNATWKETSLWYLTEPMPEGYTPQTRTFKQKSSFGVMEGTVIFYESK